MFDTHCHLQFPTSSWTSLGINKIIKRAQEAGVKYVVVPGTDLESSKKAIEIANSLTVQQFSNINLYAAVGIHPHHVFEYQVNSSTKISSKDQLVKQSSTQTTDFLGNFVDSLKQLISNPKIIAIGEVGVDRHYYKRTKYTEYQVTNEFVELQKDVLEKQISLALRHDKSLILHNREAVGDLLDVLNKVWDKKLEGRTVFHCCEPDERLLSFAKKHKIYIGVDGDVTYWKKKEEFVKKVPLEMLVLETDSPFLTPEPLRSHRPGVKRGPDNEPKNLAIIAEYMAKIKNTSIIRIIEATTQNARKLFSLI